MAQLIDFEWQTYRDWQVIEAHEIEATRGNFWAKPLDRCLATGDWAPRIITPTADNLLFWSFAEVLTEDEESVCEFARDYGCLTRPKRLTEPSNPLKNYKGESLGEWQRHRDWMQAAIKLWEAHPRSELAKLISWDEEKNEIDFPGIPVLRDFGFSAAETPYLPRFSSLRDVARFAVEAILNYKLRGKSGYHPWEDHYSGKRRFDVGFSKGSISLRPSDLAAALWLQFATAVAGDITIRLCQECGHAFEVSSQSGHRTSRKYCPGGACRQRAYRKRKKA